MAIAETWTTPGNGGRSPMFDALVAACSALAFVYLLVAVIQPERF